MRTRPFFAGRLSHRYYVLDGREPRPESSFLRWAEWMEIHDRTVKKTERDDVTVSTVFLGLDHNFDEDGPPILFETMVFVAGAGGDCRRYATWAEAENGHDALVHAIFRDPEIERPHK